MQINLCKVEKDWIILFKLQCFIFLFNDKGNKVCNQCFKKISYGFSLHFKFKNPYFTYKTSQPYSNNIVSNVMTPWSRIQKYARIGFLFCFCFVDFIFFCFFKNWPEAACWQSLHLRTWNASCHRTCGVPDWKGGCLSNEGSALRVPL